MSLKSSIWFFIHSHRRNRLMARFVRLCGNIHRASEHPGYDVNTSGEKMVLTQTVSIEAPVLFDVGANLGDWTGMAQQVCPKATIHAFELNPSTVTDLGKRFDGNLKVLVQPFGLGAKSGSVEFYAYAGDASALSGLRAPLHGHVPHTVERALLRRGDEYCQEHGVERIDFLKVDAEGADFEVVAGFDTMLARQRIGVVQFEHEAGRYLRDFYDLLAPLGYSIGKLYANYVDFREHTIESEWSLGPNYIAIPSGNHSLRSYLQQGWKLG